MTETASDRRLVYLHGFPGGPEELAAVGCAHPSIIAPNRQHDAPQLGFSGYCAHLTQAIAAQTGQSPVTLIGFSMGSRMALEIASRLGPHVESVVLVSSVAPLDTGDFLPLMAGRPIFRAAMASPLLFRALSRAQAAMAHFAPHRLFDQVFAKVAGADAALTREPVFVRTVQAMVASTLAAGASGYRREVMAFVAPWHDLLSRIAAPVTIWHGEADNWTPIGMADVLAARLPNIRAVHRLPGLSHYSTLGVALTQISASHRMHP
jgi:pimeloyl-ACP methyl ester carboxylesterase